MRKITRETIEACLECKYKGHLKLAGEHGDATEYELVAAVLRGRVARLAADKIVSAHGESSVCRNAALGVSALKSGVPFHLAARLEDDQFDIVFDGLQRVEGPSDVGGFHYLPIYFAPGRKLSRPQRAMLEIYGVLLSRMQGRPPRHAVVWRPGSTAPSRVRLNPHPRNADRLLAELRRKQACESAAPRLVLNPHCSVCEFRGRCQQQAVKEDNISLLRGMKEKEVWSYARKGILTVAQLVHTFRPRRKGRRAPPRAGRHYHSLQALAVRDSTVYVFGTPDLPDTPVRMYLDVEGNPDEGFNYLVGLTLVAGATEQRHTFWADNREQEVDIFESLLAVVAGYDRYVVFCYGSYERAFLKRMRGRAKSKAAVDRLLNSLVNVLSLVYLHFYFPTYSNGLKDVAACLGFAWTDPDASGARSIVWRWRWEESHDPQWKERLLTYNRDDCAALRRVTEFIYAAVAAITANPSPSAAFGAPRVASVADIDRAANQRLWGEARFIHPEFGFVNKCAYFDYQRQRVFVRTSPAIRKTRKKAGRQPNRHVRVGRRIRITVSRCPACGGSNVVPNVDASAAKVAVPRCKRAFDLIFTSGGIRRRVIECRSSVHECRDCGRQFVPDRHVRLARHFHGLMAWAMYLHIEHRLSFGTIQELHSAFFGITVFVQEVMTIQSLMARNCRTGFRRLVRRMLSGPVLHVDETEVKLKTGKGYVWVFASLEDVAFVYRPTREGDFLKEMLKGFKGVLVSDFYAAYDAVDCPQQKCLIHLMRDMNQLLLNHPFDAELQTVTRNFGVLLRDVVTTVDRHGLKRRHLKKHRRGVARYFDSLSDKTFQSDAAEALRERLLKNRHKLFAFIDHDGVPWNNNNAENAIKRFAYYRENTVGVLTESGLRDYLVLLSLCHTCRYRGINFLRFLLSRERDVAAYGTRRRRRHRPVIEMYPKGFVPPHLASVRNKAASAPAPPSDGKDAPQV